VPPFQPPIRNTLTISACCSFFPLRFLFCSPHPFFASYFAFCVEYLPVFSIDLPVFLQPSRASDSRQHRHLLVFPLSFFVFSPVAGSGSPLTDSGGLFFFRGSRSPAERDLPLLFLLFPGFLFLGFHFLAKSLRHAIVLFNICFRQRFKHLHPLDPMPFFSPPPLSRHAVQTPVVDVCVRLFFLTVISLRPLCPISPTFPSPTPSFQANLSSLIDCFPRRVLRLGTTEHL